MVIKFSLHIQQQNLKKRQNRMLGRVMAYTVTMNRQEKQQN